MNLSLQHIRTKKLQIDFLQERIMLLRSALEAGEHHLHNGSTGGSGGDKLSADIAKILELEERLVKAVAIFVDEVDYAEVWINQLPERERLIMQLRYIEGLTWREVAERTHYGERHCYKIHDRAQRILAS